MTGKVFAAVAHATLLQAQHQGLGQQGHHARIARKGAVTNDRALAVIQIQHRREAQVHTAGAQLGTQHIARRSRRVAGPQCRSTVQLALAPGLPPQRAEGRHGRQLGETVGAKALHATAFVVHGDQQVVPHGLDLAAQPRQLGAVLPVAGEQDHAAHQGMCQASALSGGQAVAGDVDDQGGVLLHGGFSVGAASGASRSTTTKLAA
ncbi:hypothetical protein FQZ97_794760 [compost metagenome]